MAGIEPAVLNCGSDLITSSSRSYNQAHYLTDFKAVFECFKKLFLNPVTFIHYSFIINKSQVGARFGARENTVEEPCLQKNFGFGGEGVTFMKV